MFKYLSSVNEINKVIDFVCLNNLKCFKLNVEDNDDCEFERVELESFVLRIKEFDREMYENNVVNLIEYFVLNEKKLDFFRDKIVLKCVNFDSECVYVFVM